jgi:hypothetical protein
MEFQGRVKKILPLRSGISQRTGNEWKSLPFIFEYFEHDTDRYPDQVLLETFDTIVIEHLKEGMEVRCGFAHHTREYEGRVFNEVRLYKIESIKGANKATQAAKPAEPNNNPPGFERPATSPENGKDDDLPF